MGNFLQEHVIYQDSDLLIINKPHGLLSVNGKTIFDSVLSRLTQINPKILLIHRLDRDTSGILVFALNKAAQSHISKQFQARSTKKYYMALLEGKLEGMGQIDIPVRYDETQPPLHIADIHHDKVAQTKYQVLAHEMLAGQMVTRVQLTPITGRSHQLRVHMQHLGHAIVGDSLYATEQGQLLSPRLCLHAQSLSFVHPRTEQIVCFTIDVPF